MHLTSCIFLQLAVYQQKDVSITTSSSICQSYPGRLTRSNLILQTRKIPYIIILLRAAGCIVFFIRFLPEESEVLMFRHLHFHHRVL